MWVSLGAQYILEETNVIFGGIRAAALSKRTQNTFTQQNWRKKACDICTAWYETPEEFHNWENALFCQYVYVTDITKV